MVSALLPLDGGHRTVLGRGDNNLAPRLGLCQLLLQSCNIAIDRRELRLIFQRQVPQFALQRENLALGGEAAALERAKPHGFVEPVLLRLLQVPLDRQAALAQLALRRREILGQRQPAPLQIVLPRELFLLGAERRKPARQLLRLSRGHPVLQVALGGQTGAPGQKQACDLFLSGTECFAPELGRDRKQGSVPVDFHTFSHVELRYRAGLRCEDADEALLRHQPAVDPFLSGVAREKQQAQDRRHRQGGEDREEAVRETGREQDRTQPLGLALGDDLGSEERFVRARTFLTGHDSRLPTHTAHSIIPAR